MAILVHKVFPEGLMHMIPLLSMLGTRLVVLCWIQLGKPSRSAVIVLEIPASSYFLFRAFVANPVKGCVHTLKFKISLILIEGHDIQR